MVESSTSRASELKNARQQKPAVSENYKIEDPTNRAADLLFPITQPILRRVSSMPALNQEMAKNSVYEIGGTSGTNQVEKVLKQEIDEMLQRIIQKIGDTLNANQPKPLKDEMGEMLRGSVLPENSSVDEQCIYKVPERIRQTNPEAYTPKIIAIGPFHNPCGDKNNNLQGMEKLKCKYLNGFLFRTNLSMKDLVLKVKELENRIRNCYAGHFTLDSNEFLNIIIVDACFIIEHFLRWFYPTNWAKRDPILSKLGLFREIERDLLLLENQLPFFVLEEIYNLRHKNKVGPDQYDVVYNEPFITITMHYFDKLNPQHLTSAITPPKHFLDLLRTFYLPSSFNYAVKKKSYSIPNDTKGLLYSVSQLSDAGMKFKLIESKCLFDLYFDNGVLNMPCFNVHDTTETDMKNIIAFEECHISILENKHVSQYIRVLDFLINTENDVSILIDKKIIENWMGDANEVATMVNTLCKNISMPTFTKKFLVLFHELNGFCQVWCNRTKAMLYREYFSTPLKVASSLVAILLIVLSFGQTLCSILSVPRTPWKKN